MAWGSADIKKPDYRGTLGGDSRTFLKITSESRSGDPRSGRFQALDLLLGCETGPLQEYDTPAIKVHFRGKRYFEGTDYFLSGRGFEGLTMVEGRLSADRTTVKGSLLRMEDSSSPTLNPACRTGGFIGWRAKRVPGA